MEIFFQGMFMYTMSKPFSASRVAMSVTSLLHVVSTLGSRKFSSPTWNAGIRFVVVSAFVVVLVLVAVLAIFLCGLVFGLLV